MTSPETESPYAHSVRFGGVGQLLAQLRPGIGLNLGYADTGASRYAPVTSLREGLEFQHSLAAALAEVVVARLHELQPVIGRRVLDVACGAGVASQALRLRGALPTQIDQADYRTSGAIVASAELLPIRPATHDGAISLESSAHFPSRAAFFAEVARSLTPDSPFVVADTVFARDEQSVIQSLIGSGFRLHDVADITPGVLAAVEARATALGFDGDLAAFVASHLGDQADHRGLTPAQLAVEAKLHRVGRRMLANGAIRYLVITARRLPGAAG